MNLARTPAVRLGVSASERALGSDWIRGVLSVLLGATLLAYLAAFLGISVARILYPYPLDDLEDVALTEVQRILAGQPIYVAPTLEYVPLIYGPVYFYLSAAIASVTGPGFGSLRLVATLASAASMACAALLVRRETGSPAAALLAAGLLAATYPLVNGAMSAGRTDSTCIFFLLAMLYVIRPAPRVAWWAVGASGALAGLALLTKQSSIPVVLAALVYLVCVAPRQVRAFVLAACVTVGVPMVLLSAQSDGWALFYLWDLPRRHELRPDLLSTFWRADVLPYMTVALLFGPVFLIARALARDWKVILFYALVTASMLASAWAPRANIGGARNVLLPAYAMLAILAGLGLHEAVAQLRSSNRANTRAFGAYALLVGLFQCLVLVYGPRAMAPYRSDLWADERMANKLAELQGSIFAPSYGGYLTVTRSSQQPDIGALQELTGAYGGSMTPQGRQWLAELRAALERRQYDYILLGPESTAFLLNGVILEGGYVRAGPLFPPDDQVWLWRRSGHDVPPGMYITPKADVYVPWERASSPAGQISSRPAES